jgi:hypothetical protein
MQFDLFGVVVARSLHHLCQRHESTGP